MAYGSYKYGSNTTTVISPTQSSENIQVTLHIRSDIFKTAYDRWDRNDKASMTMDLSGMFSLYITNNRGSGKRIRLQFARVIAVANNNLLTTSILYHMNYKDTLLYNGSTNSVNLEAKYNELGDPDSTMYTSGNVVLWVVLQYKEVKSGTIYNEFFKPTVYDHYAQTYVESIPVHNPQLIDISINNPQRDFYVNEEFSIGNGEVKATYKYVVDGGTYEEKVFSNFTSNPSVGSKVKNPDTTKPIEQGFKRTVTISYGGKSKTYDINVKGIKSFTKPELPQYIKLGAYTGDLENTVFTYDDDTTTSAPTNVSALVTPGFVGYFDVSYNSYASKIKQYGRWGSAENTRFEDE